MSLTQRFALLAFTSTLCVWISVYFLAPPKETVGHPVESQQVMRDQSAGGLQPAGNGVAATERKNGKISKTHPSFVVQTAPLSAAQSHNLPIVGAVRPSSQWIEQDSSDDAHRSEGRIGEVLRHGRLLATRKDAQDSAKLSGHIASREATKPQLPVVLQDLGGAVVTPAQAKVITRQQDDFIKQVGGEYQNPNDPAYLNRWISAERRAYEKLRAQIGDTAANQLATVAAQNAYNAANASH